MKDSQTWFWLTTERLHVYLESAGGRLGLIKWAGAQQNDMRLCAQRRLRSAWLESSLCALRITTELSSLDSEDWSDWVDAQADPESLLGTQFSWSCPALAQVSDFLCVITQVKYGPHHERTQKCVKCLPWVWSFTSSAVKFLSTEGILQSKHAIRYWILYLVYDDT